MTEVTVRILPVPREVGKNKIGVRTDGGEVSHLLERICQLYDLRSRLFDENDQLLYKVLINGRDMALLGGLEAPLKDGDEVMVFLPGSGG